MQAAINRQSPLRSAPNEARKAAMQVETCMGKNIGDCKETCSAIVHNSLCFV